MSELSSGLLPLPFKVRITIDKQSPNGKLLLFLKRVLLVVSELLSGLLPLPFKVRITIDKQSPNGKLYDRQAESIRKIVIIFETGSACHCEWNCRVGYCHACCTIGVVLRHCFWILFEFQVIRKGCIFTRPRIANRRRLGTSQPLELYCTIGDYFSRYDLSFKWSGKVVKDLAMIRDLMRRVCVTVTEIQTWNVAKLFQENVVWLET